MTKKSDYTNNELFIKLEGFMENSKINHDHHREKLEAILVQVLETNGKVKENTTFRLRTEGVLIVAKLVGFGNIVALIAMALKVFS